jgi:class 3 adenylate cyclase
MEREVRYCTTQDGQSIAYFDIGDGPALVYMPEFLLTPLSGESTLPESQAWFAGLSRGRRLIIFDPRGCGLSQRTPTNYSLDSFIEDLRSVVDAAGIEEFHLWGEMDSAIVALAAAARWPQRVRSVILWFGYAAPVDMPGHETFQFLDGLVETNWRLFTDTVVQQIGGWSSPEAPRLSALIRESLDRDIWKEFLDTSWKWDASPLLQSVRCPVLVMQRTGHPLFPIETSTRLAARIPDARLKLLGGSAMYPWVGDADEVLHALDAFLPGTEQTRTASGRALAFRTVLFTDLVGHTEMMSRLGDERGRDVLREHERITREVLKANGGTEVKTMGDGFMASFGSVTKAVECAVALQKAFEARNTPVGAPLGDGGGAGGAAPNDAAIQKAVDERNRGVGQGAVRQRADAPTEPLSVRVGLNAGEPIEEDGDLFGATVILASRIAAKAEGGEILVADTVRGLCSGKGFLFSDRGEFVAKGFEEPVRVYEVGWRDG